MGALIQPDDSDITPQFRLALEATPTAMIMVDSAGAIVLVNAQLEKLFGYQRAELIGMPVEQLIPHRYRDRHPDFRGSFFSAPQARPMGRGRELYGLHKSGAEVPIEIGLNPLGTSHGTYVLSSIVDITDRKRALEQLRERTADLTASLKERDVLLQEIHHRVKNNLQIISSLINMQIRRLQLDAARTVLKECKTRVDTISLIHEKLYQSRDFSNVSFPDYARSLANTVLHVSEAANRVILDHQMEPIALPVGKAIPCGLILNELLTNALKHGYPDRRTGTIKLQLRRVPEAHIELQVCDDGIGMKTPDLSASRSTIGLQLVTTLAEQLGGEVSFEVHGGTSVSVRFPTQ
jgi:two-component system, sensor histidine kinase PdtaS